MSAIFLIVGLMLAACARVRRFSDAVAAGPRRVAGGGGRGAVRRVHAGVVPLRRRKRFGRGHEKHRVHIAAAGQDRRHRRREGSPGSNLAARLASLVLAVHLRHRRRATDDDPGRPGRPAQRRGRATAAAGHDVRSRVEPRDQGPHGPGCGILSHRGRRLSRGRRRRCSRRENIGSTPNCSRSRWCRPRRSIVPWSAW